MQRRETPNNLIVFLLEEVGRGRRGAGTFYEHLVEIVELEESKTRSEEGIPHSLRTCVSQLVSRSRTDAGRQRTGAGQPAGAPAPARDRRFETQPGLA